MDVFLILIVLLTHEKKTRITGENTVDFYNQNSGDISINLQPLQVNYLSVTPNYFTHCLENIEGEPVITSVSEGKVIQLTNQQSLEWINQATFNHLRNQFPNVDILHEVTTNVYGVDRLGQFEFEAKGFYSSGTFHGTANYSLHWNGKDKIAMRSYSKKSHTILSMNDVVEVIDEDGKPATVFIVSFVNA